ncbi:MAG TPA: tetratricopeptide repeat protein [Thermoanaerobaculia bacterium]|nr:tetratricopeptide repeat protein [Thermoanaerobaculia bacterium]
MSRTTILALAAFVVAVPIMAQSGALSQAEALYAQGRYDEAAQVIAPMANDPQALFIRGKIAEARGDVADAVPLLEKAMAHNRADAGAWYSLGNAYAGLVVKANVLRQPFLAVRAREAFEQAVKLDPNHLEARYALVQFYILAPAFVGGSEAMALHHAAEIRRRDELAGHRAYASIYVAQNKRELAHAEWLAAVREHPASPTSHDGLGTFYMTVEGDYAAAEKEFETAVNLDPHWMPGWYHIGHLAAVSGRNLRRGLHALEKYLGHPAKPDEPSAAEAGLWLGKIREEMKSASGGR